MVARTAALMTHAARPFHLQWTLNSQGKQTENSLTLHNHMQYLLGSCILGVRSHLGEIPPKIHELRPTLHLDGEAMKGPLEAQKLEGAIYSNVQGSDDILIHLPLGTSNLLVE
jgi:hypothetical protein